MKNLAIIIPAIKKSVAFTDDLVKKLNGISLIQRSINTALQVMDAKHIYILTDSDEIRLIGYRNGINTYHDSQLKIESLEFFYNIKNIVLDLIGDIEHLLVLSPYCPLVTADTLYDAFRDFLFSDARLLVPIYRDRQKKTFAQSLRQGLLESVNINKDCHEWIESQAFEFISTGLLRDNDLRQSEIKHFQLPSAPAEIKNYQDWWVCEKLLQRRKIVFRVIGDVHVGMGHLYRSLSLAHEISDHEIMFVCDENSHIAVNKLAGYDYWQETYPKDKIIDSIIALRPDILINDILSTSREDIERYKKAGMKVVNFEDIGTGAVVSDLTINELYEEPLFPGKNILWGKNYFFMRDEFHDAKARSFQEKVSSVLLTFGGTDQHNLSSKVYHVIKNYCQTSCIKIYIVTGPGYAHWESLSAETKNDDNVFITRGIGVISHIMEEADLAISSNGRTLYELAHMNIPGLVISQHERENTHNFGVRKNGFIPLGVYQECMTSNIFLLEQFKMITEDVQLRRELYDNVKKHNFTKNKAAVIQAILDLIR